MQRMIAMQASVLLIKRAVRQRRQRAESDIVHFRRQASNTQARVTLEPDIEADEQSRNLLDDARVLQLAAVDRTDSWNFASELADSSSGLLIIAAHDHVAIDRGIPFQEF